MQSLNPAPKHPWRSGIYPRLALVSLSMTLITLSPSIAAQKIASPIAETYRPIAEELQMLMLAADSESERQLSQFRADKGKEVAEAERDSELTISDLRKQAAALGAELGSPFFALGLNKRDTFTSIQNQQKAIFQIQQSIKTKEALLPVNRLLLEASVESLKLKLNKQTAKAITNFLTSTTQSTTNNNRNKLIEINRDLTELERLQANDSKDFDDAAIHRILSLKQAKLRILGSQQFALELIKLSIAQ